MALSERKVTLFLKDTLESYDGENLYHAVEIYDDVPDVSLKLIFSKFHYEINRLLRYLNERIRNGHYTAHESRALIKWIDEIQKAKSFLANTPLAFDIDSYYQTIFEKCLFFLKDSGGSDIPDGFEKIQLIEYEPIFRLSEHVIIERAESKVFCKVKPIGAGAYAQVLRYRDEFYDKYFAIKRAFNNLDEKELARFEKEYREMKKLNSPYVVEVFSYNNEKHEYIMEYMDDTLHSFVNKNNSKLSAMQRKSLCAQILRAFEYLHSKKILHRDISLTNVLLKHYEDVDVVKISDFGLVKIPDSSLTSTLSEIKGSLNDRDLELYGFENYTMIHETFALTRLLYFVLTGKKKISNTTSDTLNKFIERGLNKDTKKRFQNVIEMQTEFKKVHFPSSK